MEDDLHWKTTFGGRQPSVEGDLWWKTTFSERRPSVEDDLWWKMTWMCTELSLILDKAMERAVAGASQREVSEVVARIMRIRLSAFLFVVEEHIFDENN